MVGNLTALYRLPELGISPFCMNVMIVFLSFFLFLPPPLSFLCLYILLPQDSVLEVTGDRGSFSPLNSNSVGARNSILASNGAHSGYLSRQETSLSQSSSFLMSASFRSSMSSSQSLTPDLSPAKSDLGSKTGPVFTEDTKAKHQLSPAKQYNNPIGLYSAETLKEMAEMHKLSLTRRAPKGALLRG